MKTIRNSHLWKGMTVVTGLSFILFTASCGGEQPASESDGFDEFMEDESTEESSIQIPAEVLAEMIQRIPSPVEIVALIRASGAEYSESMLNPAVNTEKYTTNYQQAFALGVYGADLGYINMYEKTISSLSYLNAVKEMADQIKVGQFFDFNTLKRLSSNQENIDSLLYITTSNFNRMDEYLREQGRSDLSVLSVAGAWLEGVYITCQVAKTTENEEIVERLGEQKLALQDIALLLNQYDKDENMAKIAKEFNKISIAYDNVNIVTTQGEPEMKEVDGRLVIVDNSSSKVEVTKETLENIIEVVTNVRNNCIN